MQILSHADKLGEYRETNNPTKREGSNSKYLKVNIITDRNYKGKKQ